MRHPSARFLVHDLPDRVGLVSCAGKAALPVPEETRSRSPFTWLLPRHLVKTLLFVPHVGEGSAFVSEDLKDFETSGEFENNL